MNSSKIYKYEYFLDYETDLQLISSPLPLPIWLIAISLSVFCMLDRKEAPAHCVPHFSDISNSSILLIREA